MRHDAESRSFKVPSFAGASMQPARADMGWIYTPSIPLRASNRRVTGNDLVLVQALASQNSQTLEDLQILPSASKPTGPRMQRHDCRNAADPLLDRLNATLEGWMRSPFRAVSKWMRRSASLSQIALPHRPALNPSAIRPVTSALRISRTGGDANRADSSMPVRRKAA